MREYWGVGVVSEGVDGEGGFCNAPGAAAESVSKDGNDIVWSLSSW
jgi:hypothetical protein